MVSEIGGKAAVPAVASGGGGGVEPAFGDALIDAEAPLPAGTDGNRERLTRGSLEVGMPHLRYNSAECFRPKGPCCSVHFC